MKDKQKICLENLVWIQFGAFQREKNSLEAKLKGIKIQSTTHECIFIHLYFGFTLILAWNDPEGSGPVGAIDQLIFRAT